MTTPKFDPIKFESFRHLDFDKLAVLLAEQASGAQVGSAEPPEEEKHRLGLAIFQDALRSLRPHICDEDGLIHRVVNSEEMVIISSLADLVITICNGLPVTLITAMISKYGIDRICHETN